MLKYGLLESFFEYEEDFLG